MVQGTQQAQEYDDELGPVDYVVVEFPDGAVSGEGFRTLVELVDRGVIRVLDLEFVSAGPDGSAATLTAAELGTVELGTVDGFDLSVFDGASSGLLAEIDTAHVASLIRPGSIAAVLVYEELSVLPAIHAWEAAGAVLVSEGPVLPDDLIESLDATEPAAPSGTGSNASAPHIES